MLNGGYGAVIGMWFVFQLLWFVLLGFHFDLEAEKYIREAQYLLRHHRFSEARYLFYFSTTAVVAFCLQTGLGLYGALFLIMLFNLLGYLYFFKALRFYFKDVWTPYLVVFLLLSFWPYQGWTLYLYTECFFYTAVLLLFANLLLYKNLTVRFTLATLLLLLLVLVSRPLGVLFVFPTLLFIFFKCSKKQKMFFSIVLALAVFLSYSLVQTVFTTTADWSLQKTTEEADIICDIPGPTPDQPLVLSNSHSQLYQLFFYVTHNFSHFIKLAAIRSRHFFTMVRDYYSLFHNGYLLLYLAAMYGSILFGTRRIRRLLSVPVLSFMVAVICLFALAVALQCDDYHNRFFLTLMPFFMTMTAVAIQPLFSFFNKHRPNGTRL